MIRPKVTIKGNFEATKKIQEALKKAKGSYVTAGVHTDAGTYIKRPSQPNPPLVTSVAWWLEYGTKFMPARPFLGPAFDENIEVLKKKMALGLMGVAFYGWSVEKGLSPLGYTMVVLIQNKLRSNVGPALSGTWEPPAGYLGRKRKLGQGQRTLIATGLLLRSVNYKMHLADGAVEEGHSKETPAPEAPPEARDFSKDRAQARAEGLLIKQRQRDQRAAQKAKDKAGQEHVGKAHRAAKAPRGKYRRK